MPHGPQTVGFRVSGKLIKLLLFISVISIGIWGFKVIQDLPRSQPESREVISPPPPAYITLHRGEEIQLQIRESEWTPWLILPEASDFSLQFDYKSPDMVNFDFSNGRTIRSPVGNPNIKLLDRKFRLNGINCPAKLLVFP